jgi:hypothetical protein
MPSLPAYARQAVRLAKSAHELADLLEGDVRIAEPDTLSGLPGVCPGVSPGAATRRRSPVRGAVGRGGPRQRAAGASGDGVDLHYRLVAILA